MIAFLCLFHQEVRMLKAIMLVSLVGLVSCASSNKTGDQGTDAVIAHLSKGPVVIGKDWEEKFTKDGTIGDELVAIGSKKDSNSMKEETMKVFAETDSTSRLLSSAPTEFKKIVQRAISTVTGDESVDINSYSVTEVKALTGMKTQFSDTQCVKTATPTMDLKYSFTTECRAIVRVPLANLAKAYNFTLARKYGISEQSDIQKKIKEEMMKEMFDQSAGRQISSKPSDS